jgi:hypothetical protein
MVGGGWNWKWVFVGAVVLPTACGDSDGTAADAGGVEDAPAPALDAPIYDASPPSDAAGTDADLGTSIRVTLRDDSSGIPIAGATVLQHDLAGVVIDRAVTNAAGRVVFAGTPSMVTALFDRFDEPVAETITLVDAGDDVVIGQQPAAPPLGTATIRPPGLFGEADSYEFSVGWCFRTNTTSPFTAGVQECAIAADGSFHVLGIAYDAADEPVAHSLFEAPAFTSDVVLPAWSTTFETVDVTYVNPPAGTLETSYQFASKDVFFPTGPTRVGATVSLPYPAPLTGGIQFSVGIQSATEFVVFLRSQMTIPTAVNVDLAAVLIPALTTVDVDVTTDPQRPTVVWETEPGPTPTACMIVVPFDDRSWVAITPGTADTAVAMPELPADLAAYRPSAGSSYGTKQVWCYAATYFEDYWQSIDPDYLPDDGTWDESLRVTLVP